MMDVKELSTIILILTLLANDVHAFMISAPHTIIQRDTITSTHHIVSSTTTVSLSSTADLSAALSTKEEDASIQSSPYQLGAWLPIGSASSLTGINPSQHRICGLDIAVWHKPLPKKSKRNAVATEWSAMVDACPHRLAPLSQGRVDPESGCIECPYHGWQFETDGKLTRIPQLEEGRTIETATGGASATALPLHKAGDLLFVFLPTDITGESWPISRLPEHHYPYLQDHIDEGRTYFVRDLPYSLDFLLENFMDPAHIPYAHHSLQGTRDDGSPLEMGVIESNFTHVEASFKDISGGKKRDGVLSFQRPALYHFRTRANATADYTPNLLVFTAPIEEGKCRAILPDFKIGPFPSWLGHLGSNRFLNTDTWLHDAERNARIHMDTLNKQKGSVSVGAAKKGRKPSDGLNYILATKSDVGPSFFRKWWTQNGLANSPPNTFGASSVSSLPTRALNRAEQIDPWLWHAKNCIKCRRALKNMRLLQKVNIVGATISTILLRRKPPLAIALALAAFYVHNFLRKFATAIEGNNNRAEINDRSVAATKESKKTASKDYTA